MSSMMVTSAALSWLIPRAIWEITYDQLKEKEMTQLFGSWIGHLDMWVQTESGQWKMHYTLTNECPGKTVTDEILPLSCIMSNVPSLFYFLWADK